jgi:uncharacterized membrane protein
VPESSAAPDSVGDGKQPVAAAKRALCADSRRALIALVAAIAVPTLVAFVLAVTPPTGIGGVAAMVVLWLLGWNVFVVAYVVLTHRTFGRVDAAEFRARMETRGRTQPWVWRLLTPNGDGPTYALESALVAFVVVLVLPHINAISINDWVLVPVSISILLSCWTLSLVSYALHYAQNDFAEPGFDFPGTRTNAFTDYVYFSIAVATTFGATDVNVTTPRMRKVVNLHVILTFIYNSVIVALLAALLIR